MRDMIDSYLTPLITDVYKEYILETVELLETLNYVAALDELNQICNMQSGISDNSMLVGRIHDCLITAVNVLLKEHFVKIKDDTPLPERNAIIKTLVYLPNYIIPEEIFDILSANYEPEETLSRVVELITGEFKYTDILDYIVEVSMSMIEHLRNYIDQQLLIQRQAEYNDRDVTRIKLINYLLDKTGHSKFSFMRELVGAGVRVGKRDLNSLIDMSFTNLEKLNALDAADQLFGLMLLSNTKQEDFQSVINTVIGEFTTQPFEQSMMEQQVRKYLAIIGDE